MNDDLERTWKEMVTTKLEEKPQQNTKTQSNWSPGKRLKPGTSEHKAGVLPTTQLCISTQQWGYISTTAINAHTAKARDSYNTKFALLSYEWCIVTYLNWLDINLHYFQEIMILCTHVPLTASENRTPSSQTPPICVLSWRAK